MNTLARPIVALFCTVFLAFSASAQGNGAPPPWSAALEHVAITSMDRTVLPDSIVHYRFKVRVGPGKFDVIRLHRVVKENAPYQPINTKAAVLLLPGTPNTVEMIFMAPLISQVPAWDHSIAIYLAEQNVDVWAMDYAWALVPAKTKNFKFMQDWGLQKDIDDTEIALWMARKIRASTGQGHGRLHLLGFSYGAMIAYSLAGEETQHPSSLRNIKGIIPVGNGMKYDNATIRDDACVAADGLQSQIDTGEYQNSDGLFLKQLADLARSDPDGSSPIIPDFTNYQVPLFVGASPAPPPTFFHFVAGYYDQSGAPLDLNNLRYTESWLWIDALRAVPPYTPVRTLLDLNKTWCDKTDVPFDDHLSEIAIPIFHVGTMGEGGDFDVYTTTLTASTDVSNLIVQLQPTEWRMVDFGHADTFLANNAQVLVWEPIRDWLVAHH